METKILILNLILSQINFFFNLKKFLIFRKNSEKFLMRSQLISLQFSSKLFRLVEYYRFHAYNDQVILREVHGP